jgi:hypothetical protein
MFDIRNESVPDAPMVPGQWKAPGAAGNLVERLAALGQLTHTDLRTEWRRLYRAHPPKRISRDLLELAVAWKLQEKALGGLGGSIKRQISSLAQTMETKGDLAKARSVKLKTGARLIREWHGETHDVLVVDDGFRWRGQHWRSLSVIAREITGTQWSGPRFFGLKVGKAAEPIRADAGTAIDLRETSDA